MILNDRHIRALAESGMIRPFQPTPARRLEDG
jgi:hypothetical protein